MRLNSQSVNAFFCSILSIVLIVSSTSVVLAQAVDVIAPVIEHTAVSSATAGEDVLIEAKVTDNVDVTSVVVFYRFKEGVDFIAVPMGSSGDDEYFVSIPTNADADSELQYYIEAVDSGGTKVTRGLSFDPIIVPLQESQQEPIVITEEDEPEVFQAPTATTTTAESTETVPAPAPSRSNNRLWYALGGVLVLGLIVGAAGGSGGGDVGGDLPNIPPDECVDGTCQVTFNLTAP